MAQLFAALRLRQANIFRWTLLSMPLLDELISGFPVVGLPLLRDQLGLSYDQVGLLFSIGALSGMVIEPFINILSDRTSKRYWFIGGLLALAASFALAGGSNNFIVLLAAFALMFPADGVGVGLAEATLIDALPQEGMQTMARWTLMGSIGDLLSPLTVAAIIALPLVLPAWTTLCWLAAALWLGAALFVWPQRFPSRATSRNKEDAPAVSALAGLREALGNPLLLRWAVLSIIPSMMDEVFIGFAALYLHDVLHASQAIISMVIAIQMAGSLLSLLALGPLLKRIAPHRLLFLQALLVLVGVSALLSLHSIWVAMLALFITSLGAAGWYPIAKAAAYAQLPGRSGTVRAVVSLGAPFEVALPAIVGFVAGRFGVLAGVGLLGLAPVLILLLVPYKHKG